MHSIILQKSMVLGGWMDGWVDGWMDGWMDFFFKKLEKVIIKLSSLQSKILSICGVKLVSENFEHLCLDLIVVQQSLNQS